MAVAARIKDYYTLAKPGMVRGNLIAAVAGFFVAAGDAPDWTTLVNMVAGLGLVIAGACVSNNYMDRGIDRKMKRTMRRAMANDRISGRSAILYAIVLTTAGAALLAVGANALSAALALFGFVAYVFLYGYGKRKTVHGTLIGTVSGAMPPVVGYVAVTGYIDGGAALLYLILTVWQMPHFYALAIMQRNDYQAAGIPVLPVVRGIAATRRQIIAYCALFVLTAPLLTVSGYTGPAYAAVALILAAIWLRYAVSPLAGDDLAWSKRLFKFSLLVLTILSAAMIADGYLPWK